jgi:hypothetical protein
LYFATGKENVKIHRLKEPDKTKYEIYEALKAAVPKSRNWNALTRELQKAGITLKFKYKGNSDEIQGIRFEKNGYTFNGSKIDRQFSFSKIDYQLKQNERAQDFQAKQHQQNQFATLENISSAIGGLFDFPSPTSDYDADEAQLLHQTKKKKKRRGFSL